MLLAAGAMAGRPMSHLQSFAEEVMSNKRRIGVLKAIQKFKQVWSPFVIYNDSMVPCFDIAKRAGPKKCFLAYLKPQKYTWTWVFKPICHAGIIVPKSPWVSIQNALRTWMIWGGPILGPDPPCQVVLKFYGFGHLGFGEMVPKRPNQFGFRHVLDFPGIISILSHEFIISRLFPKLTIDYVILCYII